VNVDSANGRVVGDADAAKLWQREYAEGWLKEPTAAT
jgi:hypothetical protein